MKTALAITLCLFSLSAHADLRVLDGDTIHLDGEKVRLLNIDAPELRQPYGEESKAELARLLEGHEIRLDGSKKDRYGRTLALVYADGVQANSEMVRLGAAWVYDAYNSDPALIPLEVAARKAKIGLWESSEQVAPQAWRRHH